jgi:hypothetical protein
MLPNVRGNFIDAARSSVDPYFVWDRNISFDPLQPFQSRYR